MVMKFNEKLKYLRESKGYTQDEIANKLNIARQSVSKWEQGINEPDFETVKKLCQILDCSIGELIDDDQDIKPSKVEKDERKAKWLFRISLMLPVLFILIYLALIVMASDEAIIHWNINGKPIYGSKCILLINIAIMLIVGLGITILMRWLSNTTEQRRTYKVGLQTIALIINILLFFTLILITAFQIRIVTRYLFHLPTIIVLSLIIVLSPFSHPKFNKRNPFIGFRSNFTLSNEIGWNKVNAFTSIALFVAGVIGYNLSLILFQYDWSILFFLIIVIALFPIFIYHQVIKKKYSK